MVPSKRVMISYAREDLQFVRCLAEALVELGVDSWIDLEDLYSAEEYWPRIREAIEGAELVVVVLSPDWTTSGPCRRELDQALQNSKRILPILARQTPSIGLPDAIASLNWVLAAEPNQIQAAAEKISRALEEDPQWARRITRLLVQAREWEAAKRSRSRLLRGAELRDAQRLLTESGQHGEPRPIALQTELVLASSRNVSRIRGYIVAGVLAALVLTSTAAVVAFIQSRLARSERVLALSRELAARSQLAAQRDSVEALELAIEAADTRRTREAEQALRDALRFSRVRHVIEGAALGLRLGSFSPDGGRLLLFGPYALPEVFDTDSGESVAAFSEHSAPVTRALFFHDSEWILTASEDSTARIWSVSGGPSRLVYEGHETAIEEALISPDGELAVTASSDGTIHTWRTKDGTDVAEGTHSKGHGFIAAAMHPSGETCAFSRIGGPTFLWNLLEGRVRVELPTAPSFGIRGIGYSPDGRYLVTYGAAETISLWDAKNGRHVQTYDSAGRVLRSDASFIPGAVAAFDYRHGLFVHSPFIPQLSVRSVDGYNRSLGDESRRAGSASFGVEGRVVVTSDTAGDVFTWAVDSGLQLGGIRVPPNLLSSDSLLAPERPLAATYGNDGRTLLWETKRRGEALSLTPETYAGGYHALLIETSAERVLGTLSSGERRILMSWSLAGAGERVLAELDNGGPPDHLGALLLTPDARRLVATWAHGKIRELDVATGEVRREFEDAPGPLRGSHLSPDGSLLLGIGVDGGGAVWTIESAQIQSHLKDPLRHAYRYRFSESGRWLLGQEAFHLRVWDAITGVVVFDSGQLPVRSAAFGREEDSLYLAGPGGLHRFLISAHAPVAAGSLATEFEFVESIRGGQEVLAIRTHDGMVLNLDPTLATTVSTRPGFARLPRKVAASEDGRYLAGLGEQGSLILLDLQAADEVVLESNVDLPVPEPFFFSTDSRYLVAAGRDGSLDIYYTAFEDLLEAARARLPVRTRSQAMDFGAPAVALRAEWRSRLQESGRDGAGDERTEKDAPSSTASGVPRLARLDGER